MSSREHGHCFAFARRERHLQSSRGWHGRIEAAGNDRHPHIAVVMGMWQAGKEKWAGIDDKETGRAVRAAFDAGINAFDTAEMYGKGHSERMLAAATADIRARWST